MAPSDGIKQYWTILLSKPELVTFDYLAAQRVWQKYCSSKGAARFHGNLTYITFMQAFMMDGIKGTRLISYLGELYKAGSDPSATGKTVINAIIKEGAVGILDYHKQMKEIEKADLGHTWLMGALYSCGFILDAIAQGQEVSPSDIR